MTTLYWCLVEMMTSPYLRHNHHHSCHFLASIMVYFLKFLPVSINYFVMINNAAIPISTAVVPLLFCTFLQSCRHAAINYWTHLLRAEDEDTKNLLRFLCFTAKFGPITPWRIGPISSYSECKCRVKNPRRDWFEQTRGKNEIPEGPLAVMEPSRQRLI